MVILGTWQPLPRHPAALALPLPIILRITVLGNGLVVY